MCDFDSVSKHGVTSAVFGKDFPQMNNNFQTFSILWHI